MDSVTDRYNFSLDQLKLRADSKGNLTVVGHTNPNFHGDFNKLIHQHDNMNLSVNKNNIAYSQHRFLYKHGPYTRENLKAHEGMFWSGAEWILM